MTRAIIGKISNYFVNQPVEKAWIFGSYSRSSEKKDSDIDILVNFLPGAKITLFQYVRLINELQLLTGKRVDLVENGQIKQFAVDNTDNDKILIYERKTTR